MALTPKPKSPVFLRAAGNAAIASALSLAACSGGTDPDNIEKIDASVLDAVSPMPAPDASTPRPDGGSLRDAGRSDAQVLPPMPPPIDAGRPDGMVIAPMPPPMPPPSDDTK